MAVNLSMFLRCINADGAISLDRLCKAVGIDVSQAKFARRRVLSRALDAVNRSLVDHGLNFKASHEAEHRTIPWLYKMLIGTGDRVRFERWQLLHDVDPSLEEFMLERRNCIAETAG